MAATGESAGREYQMPFLGMGVAGFLLLSARYLPLDFTVFFGILCFVGVAIYLVRLYYQPTNWFRRSAGAVLFLLSATLFAPGLSWFVATDDGVAEFILEGTGWLSQAVLGVMYVSLVSAELVANHWNLSVPIDPAPEPSPAEVNVVDGYNQPQRYNANQMTVINVNYMVSVQENNDVDSLSTLGEQGLEIAREIGRTARATLEVDDLVTSVQTSLDELDFGQTFSLSLRLEERMEFYGDSVGLDLALKAYVLLADVERVRNEIAVENGEVSDLARMNLFLDKASDVQRRKNRL